MRKNACSNHNYRLFVLPAHDVDVYPFYALYIGCLYFLVPFVWFVPSFITIGTLYTLLVVAAEYNCSISSFISP